MKLNIPLALTIALIGAAAIGASVAPAHATTTRTLVFSARDEPGNFALEHLGSKNSNGPGIGDLLVLTQTLTAAGKTAGAVHLAAIGVDHRRHLTQAEGTVVLNDGTIAIAGVIPQSPRFSLAVLGGTGTYTGLHGILTVTTRKHRSQITITLTR